MGSWAKLLGIVKANVSEVNTNIATSKDDLAFVVRDETSKNHATRWIIDFEPHNT